MEMVEKGKMKLSVVINTFNRKNSLAVTIDSLFHQTCGDFELVVVNGPSTDGTDELLRAFDGKCKIVDCNARNLSISRNLGIEAASGDIVAFIDDDAIADANWVRDILAGYTSDEIGGVGGITYDHTGMKLQYRYSSCDRIGETDFSITQPFDKYNIPNSDKFVYLQGTNCSFRKKCLEEIGGFDEEIEYYLDEVDVCMRIIDLGYIIKPVDNAIIHHKYLKSNIRNDDKIVLHPFSTVKNKFYFGLKNVEYYKEQETLLILNNWVDDVRNGGKWNYNAGKITKEELDVYLDEVKEAIRIGTERGKSKKTLTRQLTTNDKNSFRPFPILYPDERKLKIVYISKEYPPVNFGGIGRYTYDLATTFASKGHEVHVITEGVDVDTVDFEGGVWVHRLVSRLYKPFERMTLGWNFSLQARNYFEVERIEEQSHIDIVNGPIWLCETGMLNCSSKYATVLTLMTTQKILNKLNGIPDKHSHAYKLMELEQITLHQHQNIHAISTGILKECSEAINDDAKVFVSPLGCRDLSKKTNTMRQDDAVVVLSVGRLETRKGTDLLLKAAEDILGNDKNYSVKFIFAGKDTNNTPSGVSYKEEFIQRNKGRKEILDRVVFKGEVTEEELIELYSTADIACTPSRYESFGIVLLEGMSFSNAIIAANVGGMKDIIEDGKSGVFFEAGNYVDLKEKLESLLDNSQKRKELANNARRHFEESYSLESVYRKLIKEYETICVQISDSFNREKYAEMIAGAEQIEVDAARKAVEELFELKKNNNEAEMCSSINNTDRANMSRKMRFCASIYDIIKKIAPKLAVKLRARFFEMKYAFDDGLIRKVYGIIIRIPVLGWIFRYVFGLLIMPLRIERLGRSFLSQQTFDERLNQVNSVIDSKINELTKHNSGIDRRIDELTEYVDEKFKQNQYYNTDLKNQVIDSVCNRVTMSRSEIMFELMKDRKIAEIEKTETRIINAKKYDEIYHSNIIKLNVGAGHIAMDGYINTDNREIENIDIVCDLHSLPFENETVSEIYASHVLEHFTKIDLEKNIIPYWKLLLKKGGVIIITIPDLESMIQEFGEGNYGIEDLREVLYGLQEYPGDIHYGVYGREEFKQILENIGLKCEYVFCGRKNGKCYDMRIIAKKQ